MAPEELTDLKPQVYKDPRPAAHFERYHARSRRREPDWVYGVVRLLLTPYLLILHRARCIGSDQVPADGPVTVAPSPSSFLDVFFVAVFLRLRGRSRSRPYLFIPPIHFRCRHGGVFPVRR